jgi:monoamine oxidase
MKQASGTALQVFLEFETAFWEGKVPAETGQFGITLAEGAAHRGMASTIWNFKPFTGAPILCSLLIGTAAERMAGMSDDEVEASALGALRSVFGDAVPPVVRRCCARWGEDEFATGSYSYVAVGGSGDSYDLMARPLGRSVLFAGEHTTKEHLDTVGGAMRTGVREVRRGRAPVSCALLRLGLKAA